MKTSYSLFLLLLSFTIINAQDKHKYLTASRIDMEVEVDGQMSEPCWKDAERASGFLQFSPQPGDQPHQKSEVRFLYDDQAIYIGAMLYDATPDSILRQLGNRDDELNADQFLVSIDTYDSGLDAFVFGVYASGVQVDFQLNDDTFNAVWNSRVKITEQGWQLEMRIPYSAFRFPSQEEQVWRLNFVRKVRRTREESHWGLIQPGDENQLKYYGKLQGVKGIQAPLRLSMTPYLSGAMKMEKIEGQQVRSSTFAGGMDLRYGINESFTLDMTLLPDFSQVRSDNRVKNLGAFEVIYDENRPFFLEGMELFNRGDLFYSRRVGSSSIHEEDVEDQLQEGEEIISNPAQTKLVNATKVSGRTKKGTGLGLFNAVVRDQYARVSDSLGGTREIKTNPWTNYNIFVLDQNLKNNSSFYVINTNVSRAGADYDANVLGAGTNLANKKTTWMLLTRLAYSQLNGPAVEEGKNTGLRSMVRVEKITGNFKFGLGTFGVSPNFDSNDLGTNFETNFRNTNMYLGYHLYEPFGVFNKMFNNFNFNLSQRYTSPEITSIEINYNAYMILKNFHSFFFGGFLSPLERKDYFEPRVDGRYFMSEKYGGGFFGISSDYRKKLAIDAEYSIGVGNLYAYTVYQDYSIEPIVRFSDKFTWRHRVEVSTRKNQHGFADFDDSDEPIFGNRDVRTLTNMTQARYLFINNMSLGINLRHYWSQGKYSRYFNLLENGYLKECDYSDSEDFNFTSFNIDLVYSWQFAPGSILNFVYKNTILEDGAIQYTDFYNNLRSTFDNDQTHVITIKLLYFLDYQDFRNRIVKK